MILIPFLCLLSWTLGFRRWGRDYLESGLAALIACGVTVAVATELQSLVGMLTPAGSALAWTLSSGCGLAFGRRGGQPAPAADPVDTGRLLPELVLIAIFLGLTAVVALVSAPNSYDGFTYHLVRVEQWVQQGSLRPFATYDTRQLSMPSFAAYAVLQLRLLSGGDRFANLVQWIGFAGACGGAAMLTRGLGGGRSAAILAGGLVATLPMAVAQASGTQTDLIAACWAVLACGFGYRLVAGPFRGGGGDAVLSALAFGLAVATKQTAALLGGAALLPAIGVLAWRDRRRGAAWVVALVLAVGAIVGPQLARNWTVFGTMNGDPIWTQDVVSSLRAPNAVLSTALRNLSVHFGTPWSGVNRAVAAGAAGISRVIGADPDDPRTTWDFPFKAVPWTTHEESAPNPLHLLLLFGCLIGLLRSRPGAARALFLGGLLAGFVAFSAMLKWQSYGSRLQTPLFVLALAWAAVVLEPMPLAGRRALLGLLTLGALPVALLNYTRPLLTLPKAAITPRPSILSLPRNLRYFLYAPEVAPEYYNVALRIADSGCTDVGISAVPHLWEYPLWVLARNAGSDPRFRYVGVENASARFAPAAGPPCLLVRIGLDMGPRPGWAADWTALADWRPQLGKRGIAVFAPPR